MPRRSELPHAILVRDYVRPGRRFTRLLAKDIPSGADAERIVSRLAASYAHHGTDPAGRVHWFRDGAGLHQLWVQRRD